MVAIDARERTLATEDQLGRPLRVGELVGASLLRMARERPGSVSAFAFEKRSDTPPRLESLPLVADRSLDEAIANVGQVRRKYSGVIVLYASLSTHFSTDCFCWLLW